jgi:hypothetical protein
MVAVERGCGDVWKNFTNKEIEVGRKRYLTNVFNDVEKCFLNFANCLNIAEKINHLTLRYLPCTLCVTQQPGGAGVAAGPSWCFFFKFINVFFPHCNKFFFFS